MAKTDLLIGLVGPCKSGKTELKTRLEQNGYRCRHISQEHSFVPNMWQQISHPDVLIYLDVSYKNTLLRGLNWNEKDYQDQLVRLGHAYSHADHIINTNDLSIEEVFHNILIFLQSN